MLLLPFVTRAQQDDSPKVEQSKHLDYYRYDQDHLSKEFHAERRAALREKMPAHSVAVLFANPVRNRSNDVNYEYHQDPNFYYLTGFTEPHAVLLIFKDMVQFDSVTTNEILFMPERDPRFEVWNGRRLGVQNAPAVLGIQTAFKNTDFKKMELDLSEFDEILPIFPMDDMRDDPRDEGDLYSMADDLRHKTKQLGKKVDPTALYEMMAALRSFKQPEELALMRKAIDMTGDAQIALMKALKPGMTEYESEAIIEYVFKKNGAEYPGFPSILGGGENSCVLHYTTNRKPLKGSNMLVSDVGAEYHGYTADVTRTLPVDGKFSEEEKIIYNIVYQAQAAGIEACRPGARFWDPNAKATEVIARELKKLGIIEKDFQVRKYFMHGTSHYLGLDVHDAGLYDDLAPGQVITVEPGIYIPEGADCDKKWWNIGIRIEDDVLITEDGYEVLSDKAPKTVEEIEAMMQEKSIFDNPTE